MIFQKNLENVWRQSWGVLELFITMGCIINIPIGLESGINEMVVPGGMISGLASTGLYETMRNLLNRDGSLPGMPDRK